MPKILHLPGGVWAPVLTPFLDDNCIDWEGLERLIDWYFEAGVTGLFVVCQSGEMYSLTGTERLELAQTVVRMVNGRVPVVASGTFGGSVGEQVDFAQRMGETGVDAVVCLPCHFVEPGRDDAYLLLNLQGLLEALEDVPLGLYECSAPYHRLLSVELLEELIKTRRFFFLQETSGNPDLFQKKNEAAQGSALRLLNGHTLTLLESLQRGGSGYCGKAANFCPDLLAWLCRYHEERSQESRDLQEFLALTEFLMRYNYPASAKHLLQLRGVSIGGNCRQMQVALSAEERQVFSAYLFHLRKWQERLKLPFTR